jgi:peptide/nickel transport system permease protein
LTGAPAVPGGRSAPGQDSATLTPARPKRQASPRVQFLIRRLRRLVISIALVVVATFMIVHLVPGDPVRAVLGPSASPELVARVRAELGLDQPPLTQFVNYVVNLFHGNLGESLQSHRPVLDTLLQRLPATLVLAVSSFLVAALLSLPAGIGTAIMARSGRHRGATSVISAFLGFLIAVPNFLISVGLIALFSILLGLLPAAGWGDFRELILPVTALAITPWAYLVRIVHVEMLNVLDTPYMTTARAKRLPASLIYLRHALPNMLTSALTIGGMMLTGLVAATVLIETIFAIPGLGTTIVSSITTKDYPMIQGVVLFYATLVLGMNLIVDLILMTVDPRSSITEG